MDKNQEIQSDRAGRSGRSQRVQTVIGIILCVLLIPILTFNCIMIARSYIHPDRVPGIGGTFPLIVMSDSMYPMFQTGDMLICHSVDPAKLKEDDVIIYYVRSDSADNEKGFVIVAHRITDINEKDGKLYFTTKGDANTVKDPDEVSADDVIGIYKRHIKGLGRVCMFLQTTAGMILCIAVPIILLVGIDLLRRRRWDKRAETEKEKLMAELEELRRQKEKAESKDRDNTPEA